MAIIEIRVPSPGETITHVELYKWLVADGAVVTKNSEIAELESEKATLTLVAEESGKVSLKAKEGDSLEVGSLACTIDTAVQPETAEPEPKSGKPASPEAIRPEQPAAAGPATPKQPEKGEKPATGEYENVKVTPLAKRVMEENDLSVEDVINGLRRLKRSDVEAVLSASGVAPVSGLKKPASRESKTSRMSSLRRKLSERLVAVKNETAMLTTFNEVNMKPIMDLRKKYQDKFVERHGIKLGMMSFFMKACAIALQEFPSVNSTMEGENITSYDYADISVAVSTPKGLLVPVIRNVESMGLAVIEKAVAAVADKARKGKLAIPEMTGGTFTITNGGVFGSMMSTPIINPPQSAILGMHNIMDRPVVIDGEIVVRPMMYVALSYDHRMIDGRESVGFLVRVKQLLENPTDMLFGKSSGEKELLEL
jgi:2-oxoglutarate dehydrogenase E2 component (dihydrolipoamide succinyltransferase)